MRGTDWCDYVPPSEDAWRWRGLGKVAARYHAELEGEPVTAVALARRFGVTPRTARRHLASLEAHGLAERGPDGWIRGAADPEEVARSLFVESPAEKQRERHRRDRRAHREYLARNVGARIDTRVVVRMAVGEREGAATGAR